MKTILILEDDVIFSRSISNWLKKKGMATEHVATLSAPDFVTHYSFILYITDK